MAPADSPQMVTLAGSPPNLAMLSCEALVWHQVLLGWPQAYLNPLQTEPLIAKAQIRVTALCSKVVASQEAKASYAIVDGHVDDRLFQADRLANNTTSIVLPIATELETPSIHPKS